MYDESYPTKDEITAQLFRVLEKYPKLKIAVAHFGFFISEKENAERFLGEFENTTFDITPGGEQYFKMLEDWTYWKDFIERYQDRIFYGTDFYAFQDDNEEGWRTAFMRRPRLVRQFFETDTEHEYIDKPFRGVKLDEKLRTKIYWDNGLRRVGEPKPIDEEYIKSEAKRLLSSPYKVYDCSDEDLRYILEN